MGYPFRVHHAHLYLRKSQTLLVQDCPSCGKKTSRKKTVEHTINPFNKNANGVPKSRQEVVEDVKAVLETWKKEPVYHAKCEKK